MGPDRHLIEQGRDNVEQMATFLKKTATAGMLTFDYGRNFTVKNLKKLRIQS
ncbi:MAG: hypothetical protein JXB29_04940 [Sedimentisphaerales bacterium]|nr:hypothetical protein [Sedimentisphaerales bacterium]